MYVDCGCVICASSVVGNELCCASTLLNGRAPSRGASLPPSILVKNEFGSVARRAILVAAIGIALAFEYLYLGRFPPFFTSVSYSMWDVRWLKALGWWCYEGDLDSVGDRVPMYLECASVICASGVVGNELCCASHSLNGRALFHGASLPPSILVKNEFGHGTNVLGMRVRNLCQQCCRQ